MRTGMLTVVCSVGVLSEGVDLPEVKCAALLRPTMSLALFLQQSARCMTPWPNGPTPRILDIAGNAFRHGLPQEDREWSLDATSRVGSGGGGTAGRTAPPVKRCGCGGLSSCFAGTCSACGAAFQSISLPVVLPSELHQLDATKRQIEAERLRIGRFADQRGFGREWVEKVIALKFGGEKGHDLDGAR